MRRVIKFRVVDPVSRYALGYEALIDGQWKWRTRGEERWLSGKSGMFTADNVLRLQSTGHVDKNGVEIFEGDIIVTWQKNSVGKSYAKHVTRRVVKWMQYTKATGFNLGTPTHIEVIGNVYENPELLEKAS